MEEAGILPCLPRKSPASLALRAAPFLTLHMPAPRGRRMNPSMGLGWGILPQTLPRGAGMCRALVRAYRDIGKDGAAAGVRGGL